MGVDGRVEKVHEKGLDTREALEFSHAAWKEGGRNFELLSNYLSIRNVSPQFDSEWETRGAMDQAVDLYVAYAQEEGKHINGLEIKVLREEGRTPLIIITAEGTKEGNTLMYGHLDKQPECGKWDEDTPPWQATVKDGKLYGRGGADDGYALPAALTSIRMLDEKGIPRPRCTIIIEAGEESGSKDLKYHLTHEEVVSRMGKPDTIVCLDSGAGDYNRLWETTSLRGLVDGTLEVKILDEGKHSGNYGGLGPTSSRVMRNLLDRLEDSKTGKILPPEFHVDIPEDRKEQIRKFAPIVIEELLKDLVESGATGFVSDDPEELVRNVTWEPTLEIIGADDIPPTEGAGNTLRPKTRFRLSLRTPPTANGEKIAQRLKEILEADPEPGAEVTFTINSVGNGLNVKDHTPAFRESIAEASKGYFGEEVGAMGVGGSIPFMKMLQDMHPDAQFLITGVLGPGSNAHGPNEFLDLEYVSRLTASLGAVVSGPR
jgi:acetylornithine deacetylase/succinyl-diaminopimelate desuccinylase-like protein